MGRSLRKFHHTYVAALFVSAQPEYLQYPHQHSATAPDFAALRPWMHSALCQKTTGEKRRIATQVRNDDH
jgi:hypothetical protein